jgi:xyloglucan-specific endo-beta-1,4-glucanase
MYSRLSVFSLAAVIGAAVVPAFAIPAPPSTVVVSPPRVEARTPISTICGQWDVTYAADFIIENDLWGESAASSGSQCTELDYDSGNTLSWQTFWTWEGGQYDVKSYSNAVLNIGATQLSSISSLPTTWTW